MLYSFEFVSRIKGTRGFEWMVEAGIEAFPGVRSCVAWIIRVTEDIRKGNTPLVRGNG